MSLSVRILASLAASYLLLATACDDPKPALSGRLRAPAGVAKFVGCAQNNPACNHSEDGRHLLLVSNSMADDVRIFDVEKRSFFEAFNPFFPMSIPVGQYPRGVAVDPFGEWAMVANQLSEDVSLINLAPNRLVEVDTDGDPSTVAASLNCPAEPHQVEAPTNDRCRMGVSRAPLSDDGALLLPDQIAIPAGDQAAEDGAVWPRDVPLPVWVSLPAAGRVALLEFRYPSVNNPQLLTYVGSIDLGGRPSGLAISADGSWLYVADEDSDSIAAVDTLSWEVTRVLVDGPTRRVYLTPDESVVYAVRLDEPRIGLVDTETLERRPVYVPEDPRAQNPDRHELDIQVPGIPREITFVTGQTIRVEGFDGDEPAYPQVYIPRNCDWPEAERLDPPTTTFAYISDLNGNVYIVDAQRHGPIDLRPTVGPSAGPAGYLSADEDSVKGVSFLERCSNVDHQDQKQPPENDHLASCPYPYIAYMHQPLLEDVTEVKEYGPDENPNNSEAGKVIDKIVNDRMTNGVRTFPGVTRTEGWIFTWEGVLPNTGTSSSGRFEGVRFLDDRAGVNFEELGAQDQDLLEVLTARALDPNGSGDIAPACLDSAGNARKNFRIDQVGEGGDSLVIRADGVDLGQCWPGAVLYQIRAADSWTVVGTESGIHPRLTRDMMLPWDAGPPSEAFTQHASLYDNGHIALTMVEPGPQVIEDENGEQTTIPAGQIPRGSTWGFNTESGYASAFFAPSVRIGMAGGLVGIDLEDGAEQDRDETYCDTVSGPAIDRVYVLFEASNALMEFFPSNMESGNFLLYQ